MKDKNQNLQEKASTPVGGGATGASMSAEPTNAKAKAPGNSKEQGETATQKLEGDVEMCSLETNTNPTGDMSAKNRASVAMKEDMEAMFDGEQLSEAFKEKATTFFEAAVHARVEEQISQLQEEYNTKLAEEVEAVAASLTEKVDEYLNYVASEWMQENQLAVESALRTEITEDFIEGLKSLFAEHYINVPEEKVDVIEQLVQENQELTDKLNETIESHIELEGIIDEQARLLVFNEVTEGLAASQVDKLKSLSEGIEYGDVESFQKKLETLKEGYFGTKKTSQLIIESEIDNAELPPQQAAPVAPEVARYVNAISRTIKK